MPQSALIPKVLPAVHHDTQPGNVLLPVGGGDLELLNILYLEPIHVNIKSKKCLSHIFCNFLRTVLLISIQFMRGSC